MWKQVYGVQLYNVSSANWTEPGLFLVSQKRDVKNPHQGETFPLEKKNVAPRQERKRNKCIFPFPFREIHLACHPALRRVTTPSLLIRVPLREITRVITLTSGWENLKIGRVQFPFVLHMEKRSWMRKHTRKSEKGVRHYQWGEKNLKAASTVVFSGTFRCARTLDCLFVRRDRMCGQVLSLSVQDGPINNNAD